MHDIEELNTEIDAIRREIQESASEQEQLEAKLRELAERRTVLEADLADRYEAAARILRNGTAESSPERDLVGATIRQAAAVILNERPGHARHFADIADEAVRRGFPERRDRRTTRQSFRRMMHKTDDIFQRMGDGTYRLIQRN
jgi:chromosome segregation ATPase